MKVNKITLLLSLLVILSIVTLGCTQNSPTANNGGDTNEKAKDLDLPKELVISSGPSGGLWYTQGIATADLLTTDNVKVTSVAGGGQANFIAVGDGKADIGFTTTDMFDDAYAGVEPFGRSYDDVVMLMRQDSTFTFIIVPADSDIYSLKDLKGKKIGTPNPGTSSAVTIEKLFTTAGIAGQVNEVPGSISEIIEQLRDRLLDGICTAFGSGNAALTELAMSIDLRFIPIEEDV